MGAERISTIDMSRPEWIDARHGGIGGSDVSSVLGLNPYKASAELFYEKVLRLDQTEENEAMFFGKQLENKIAELWQYWDPKNPTADEMIRNYNAANIKRRCRKANAIFRHSDYPWLLANLDRTINMDLQTLAKPGVLEIKTVSGWAADQWKEGIPPYYLIQLQAYLLVTGYSYGEIVILRDGRYMNVIPFGREEEIIDKIITKTKSFWDSIETARTILLPYTSTNEINCLNDLFNLTLSNEVKESLSELEPAPDDSVAYENYLKDRYRIVPLTKQGTSLQLEAALNYMSHSFTIKAYERFKREISNKLKNEMAEAEVLDFGASGKITHRQDSRGVRRFVVKVEGGKE